MISKKVIAFVYAPLTILFVGLLVAAWYQDPKHLIHDLDCGKHYWDRRPLCQ